MSGHSKWSTIKHKKGIADAKRGKIFTKIGREIVIAVRAGGSDITTNSRLRDVITKAKANNMPNDNIDRSIKKATGEGSEVNFEEIVYEGYGPAGVAVIVEAATDNKNRTAGDVRHHFDKCGGNLGTSGCVSWMFDKKGQIIIEKTPQIDADNLMMLGLEAGAQDFLDQDEYFEILTEPSDFSAVLETLEKTGIKFESAGIEMIPQNYTKVSESDMAKLEKLIDMLEDNDDVQNVYTNVE